MRWFKRKSELKIGKESPIPRMKSSLDYVVFENTCIGIVPNKKGKEVLIISTYNGHGKWTIRSISKIDSEVAYKFKRIYQHLNKRLNMEMYKK